MRSLRSWVVLVALCLFVGASVAAASETSSAPARRETSGIGRIFGQLGSFLKFVWDNTGCDIDPWGRPCASNTDSPADENSGDPSADEGCEIDPLG
jgi:hypothetical protein